MSYEDRTIGQIMEGWRHALSEHDTQAPATPAELRDLAASLEEVCIANECQFSHPDWRFIDGLRALASQLDGSASRSTGRPDNG